MVYSCNHNKSLLLWAKNWSLKHLLAKKLYFTFVHLQIIIDIEILYIYEIKKRFYEEMILLYVLNNDILVEKLLTLKMQTLARFSKIYLFRNVQLNLAIIYDVVTKWLQGILVHYIYHTIETHISWNTSHLTSNCHENVARENQHLCRGKTTQDVF